MADTDIGTWLVRYGAEDMETELRETDIETVEDLLVWVKSIREVTRIFNEHGIQVSHSKVYQIQVQRDDLEAGRPNTRVIRPLPKQAQFHAVGKRVERYL